MDQGMELRVESLVVSRKGKCILNNVSFQACPGDLTAIIGPNGAGKTTLMRALSGERPDSGQVLINGEDMYEAPEYWLQQIGYVPVDNILHDHLSLQEALQYVGKLRLVGWSDAKIAERADELLNDFGFAQNDERRHKPLKVLSSGERKRANVCSELMVDPPILMLDEPTSNLDPDAERNLMIRLAEYARTYTKTVLVITHTLNTLVFCHQVAFVANGEIIEQGEPEVVLKQLETSLSPDQPGSTQSRGAVLRPLRRATALSSDQPESTFLRWAAVFDHHATKERYEADNNIRKSFKSIAVSQPRHNAIVVPWIQQLQYLLRRYLHIRLGDRGNLIFTLLVGLSGILFFVLPGNTFIKPFEPSEISVGLNQARESVYIVSLVVTLIGLITSYTEISKEFRIYRHERLKGLSASAYVLSKWIWLSVLVGILAPILILGCIVLLYSQPLPGFPEPRMGVALSWWEHFVQIQLTGLVTSNTTWLMLGTLILACITSMTLGLLISALAGDSGRGYLLLSMVVVFIVLFSGLIRNAQLAGLIDRFAIASAGKWAYEGLSSTISVYCWTDSWRFDEFTSSGHIVSVWLALLAFILIAGLLAVFILRLRDPWYGSWMNLKVFITKGGPLLAICVCVIVLLVSYTVFLRDISYTYHTLNYWNRQEYGGTNAYVYAQIRNAPDADWLQRWLGSLNQARCE